MKAYLDTLQDILMNGDIREDRTGVGTKGIFGTQTRYDLRKSFPAVTTKRLAWKAVVSELIWFLEGSGDERRLAEILHGTRDKDHKTIWTGNANADYWTKGKFPGDLGRVYGVQWRSWQYFAPLAHSEGPDDLKVGNIRTVDQIANLVRDIKENPFSRRHILTSWNPGELDNMALPPCHLVAQFHVKPYTFEQRMDIMRIKFPTVSPDANGYANKSKMLEAYSIPTGELSCQMYQRSADMFLGVPFNIASYSLFTYMLAQVTGLAPGEFIHTIGDAHIYLNHIEQVEEQLSRKVLPPPQLSLNPAVTEIDGFTMDDITLNHYQSHPSIKAKMAV